MPPFLVLSSNNAAADHVFLIIVLSLRSLVFPTTLFPATTSHFIQIRDYYPPSHLFRLSAMAPQILPFRDVNLHASPSHYAFTSPSSPQAPTLVVDRPTGDLRLNDGPLSGAKRISSIAGILGIVKLKLGNWRSLWNRD